MQHDNDAGIFVRMPAIHTRKGVLPPVIEAEALQIPGGSSFLCLYPWYLPPNGIPDSASDNKPHTAVGSAARITAGLSGKLHATNWESTLSFSKYIPEKSIANAIHNVINCRILFLSMIHFLSDNIIMIKDWSEITLTSPILTKTIRYCNIFNNNIFHLSPFGSWFHKRRVFPP